MRLTTLMRVGMVILFAALFTACDSFPASDRLGIGLDSGGSPEILFISCDGQSVSSVTLVRAQGESPWDGDDELLWKISAADNSREERFVVGSPPSGYEEEQPLEKRLDDEHDLAVRVGTSDGFDVASRFKISELRPNQVLTALDKDFVDQEAFISRAREEC
jgi:hypothetical protein